MVNITDSSVPTGTYSFRNVKHGKVIRVVDGQEELTSGDANAASGDNSDKVNARPLPCPYRRR